MFRAVYTPFVLHSDTDWVVARLYRAPLRGASVSPSPGTPRGQIVHCELKVKPLETAEATRRLALA